ncbi:peptidyl-prolyl cis-trans isomerase [Candidatus Saccharibacteria bacterium]|nr:peptidyl-prolyl cis-trans isomerase [Candidatus Saccharibacteria bacterium]
MKRPTLKKSKKEIASPSRITNETVAEHREQILAGGRKFKYPHQYERHKVVFNVVLIAIVTIVVLAGVIWWQLYPVQNTSTFFYRVTRILPLPVASVDGTQVRYSDYLMSFSGSQHYLEQSERLNLKSEDGKRQIEFIKRQALDGAIADAYAGKLAREKNISVTEKQVSDVIEASLTTVSGKISQDIYDDSTLSTLGYSAGEYRQIIRRSLIRQEVAYAIDTKANNAKKAADTLLTATPKPALADVAKQLQDKGYPVQLGSTGSLVPRTNHDGGVTQQAAKLKVGDVSSFFRSSDGSFERNGYYVVQLVESNDKQVSYNYIRIPLTALNDSLKTLTKNNKIQEYIDVKSSSSEVIRK